MKHQKVQHPPPAWAIRAAFTEASRGDDALAAVTDDFLGRLVGDSIESLAAIARLKVDIVEKP